MTIQTRELETSFQEPYKTRIVDKFEQVMVAAGAAAVVYVEDYRIPGVAMGIAGRAARPPSHLRCVLLEHAEESTGQM